MAVPSTIADLSTTAASNSPAGSDAIGTSLDDYLRVIQAIVKAEASSQSDIASASTITPAAAGSTFHVTGTTAITAIGSTNSWNGRIIFLTFDGALTLTHNGTSLILPGAANITTAAGDCAILKQESSGNWRCLHYQKASGAAVVVSSTVVRAALAGLTMSTAGSSATMTIAAGQAADSTNAVYITLASAMSKTTSAWAAGTAAGGLDTGAIANSTTYHFYVISKTDGTTDVVFSTNASTPSLPSGYTYFRRIGAMRTNGSAQWTSFVQDGDYFRLLASVLDVNTTNPGTAAVSATLTSVPTGVKVFAMFNAVIVDTTPAQRNIYFSDLDANDEASVASGAGPLSQAFSGSAVGSNIGHPGQMMIRTNTSSQIRYRLDLSSATTTVQIATLGWIDRRGRDA